MTFVIEDRSRRFKGVGSGGKEQHVLKTRFNALLPVATRNLQSECLTSLRRALSTDGVLLLKLDSNLKVHDGSTTAYILVNKRRKLIVQVYYLPPTQSVLHCYNAEQIRQTYNYVIL